MYRVFDPPAGAPSFIAPRVALSLPKFTTVVNPRITPIGDSLACFNANTTGRSDMLVPNLERWFRNAKQDAAMTLTNRAIGGQTYATFQASMDTAPLAADLPWWPLGEELTWKQRVQATSPDVLPIAFGMNDGAGVRPDLLAALLAEIPSWPSAPNPILCTNLLPSFADGQRAAQDARDRAAGVTRSMAKYFGVPFLDFHRQMCAARDGFDPCESTFRNVELTSVLSADRRSCPEETIDFIAQFTVDLDALGADLGKDKIVIRIGPLSMDWLRISKTAGPGLRFELSSGQGSSPYSYRNCVVPWPGGIRTYRIEVKDNLLTMYDPTVGGPEGTNQAALFTSKIIRGGGWFTPYVMMVDGAADLTTVTSVSFWTAVQRAHGPTITNAELYGGAGSEFEGTFGNHPGNKAGAYIYAPVLAQAFIR